MSTIVCTVSDVEIESDSGRTVDGVQVKCGRCGHTQESYGTSDASVRRCMAALRENCPREERNFYVEA